MSWYEQPGSAPPGWYPDPSGHGQRWWDGSRWTEHYVVPRPVGPPPPALQQPATPSPTARDIWPPPEFWVASVALVTLLAGSVGPWVTLSAESIVRHVGGLRGDAPGVLTLLAGVTAGVLLCVWLFQRVPSLAVAAALMGVVATVVAIQHVADPASGADVPDIVDVSAAWGVWACLVASLVLVTAATSMTVRTRTRG